MVYAMFTNPIEIATQIFIHMKLDLSAIENYSQQYATKLCDEFFSKNSAITGKQILQLSNVAQVNMFVVSDLYEKWKSDTETFKSPYFNFDSEEVKSALQTFMNTVSQHIMVKREVFEPILTKSVDKTLTLLFDPSKYFDDFVRDSPEFTLTQERLAQLSKYTKINKSIPEALVAKMGDEKKTYVTTALNWLNEASENVQFEDTDKYLTMFSTKIPLTKQMLVKQTPNAVQLTDNQGGMKMSQSFFDADPEELEDDEDAPLPTVASVTAAFEKEPTPEVKLPNSLNESFDDGLPTVNDLLKKEVIGNGMTFTQHPVKTISEAISLNQKFIFIGRLFDGDIISYNKAIEDLDACTNFTDAKAFMNRALAPKYNWIMAAEEADEFLEIIGRRFS
jgi:hypothetical protein